MLNSIENVEHYRQEEKRKARSGDIACILFKDLENKENRKPMDHNGNRLFFPKTTLEEIDYDKIKFKHSVNNSKLKTELVQFYKDGILIKLPAHKKLIMQKFIYNTNYFIKRTIPNLPYTMVSLICSLDLGPAAKLMMHSEQ